MGVFSEASIAMEPPQIRNRQPPPGSTSPSSWSCPSPGRYKLNVDAAVINGGRSAAGIVIRDGDGMVVRAATRLSPFTDAHGFALSPNMLSMVAEDAVVLSPY
ncbi:hypothetical protein PIB30_069394 [Stylosanthes scabra]|uniref:RNase H type-1 domain-containing protein n=1 Tax=Stylosanthes scabra TaxID=79078 RepID=A0ABU6RP43_9FABA|nr:hypothetical protein [Stylosanthes scabra]